jgi:hypothetical protein
MKHDCSCRSRAGRCLGRESHCVQVEQERSEGLRRDTIADIGVLNELRGFRKFLGEDVEASNISHHISIDGQEYMYGLENEFFSRTGIKD